MESLACQVAQILEKVCAIEETLGDVATLTEICEKVDNLNDKICGPCSFPVVGEMTATSVVLAGDPGYQPGDVINLQDADGNPTGETAEVVSSTYDAETDQATVQLTNVTAAPAALTSIKSVKKARAAAPVEEGPKKEAAEVAAKAARG